MNRNIAALCALAGIGCWQETRACFRTSSDAAQVYLESPTFANERRTPSLPALADTCDTDDCRFFVLSTRGRKVRDSKEHQRVKTYGTHFHVQTTQAIPHKLHF